jgi:hypothetical protein
MTSITYAAGLNLPNSKPVLLVFQLGDRAGKLTTSWTIEDAEMMAHALLRNAEKARRYMIEHPPRIKLP